MSTKVLFLYIHMLTFNVIVYSAVFLNLCRAMFNFTVALSKALSPPRPHPSFRIYHTFVIIYVHSVTVTLMQPTFEHLNTVLN